MRDGRGRRSHAEAERIGPAELLESTPSRGCISDNHAIPQKGPIQPQRGKARNADLARVVAIGPFCQGMVGSSCQW
jgi:hypothetical protein